MNKQKIKKKIIESPKQEGKPLTMKSFGLATNIFVSINNKFSCMFDELEISEDKNIKKKIRENISKVSLK